MVLKAMFAKLRRRSTHIVHHDDGWVVEHPDAHSIHRRKRHAIQAGIDLAREHATMLVIHGRDGKVQETHNYG